MSDSRAEQPNKTEQTEVSSDELVHSNMMSIEALFRVLQKKGIVTQREVLDELTLVKKEMSGKAS